jgi:NTE family protein
MSTKKDSISLVLSGSGILYPYHAGAVRRISEEYKIEKITGVSGGAIVGAAIASGYSPGEELENLILNTLPSKNDLLDWNWFPFFKWGLIKGNKILKEFSKHYDDTFQDLDIPFQAGTVNLNKKRHRNFNPEDDPHFSVARAVRASMTFPAAFEPVEIDRDYYVDGGVMSYYPIDTYKDDENTIGVKIEPKFFADLRELNDIWEYFGAIFQSMMTSIAREKKQDAPNAKTVKIRGQRGPLDLDITRGDAKKMIEQGYRIADRGLS